MIRNLKQFTVSLDGHPAHAQIIDGYLVIAIEGQYLNHLVESDPDREGYDEDTDEVRRPKVTDSAEWLADVVGALNSEQEDGSNMITRMLDKSFTEAIENGSDAVQLPED